MIYLQDIQKNHSKVKHIKYTQLRTQAYLKSALFSNDDVKLVFALRTRTAEQFKANFPNKYQGRTACPLQCKDENGDVVADTQQHLLSCDVSKSADIDVQRKKESANYEHLFSDNLKNMKDCISLYKELLRMKENHEKRNIPVELTGPLH